MYNRTEEGERGDGKSRPKNQSSVVVVFSLEIDEDGRRGVGGKRIVKTIAGKIGIAVFLRRIVEKDGRRREIKGRRRLLILCFVAFFFFSWFVIDGIRFVSHARGIVSFSVFAVFSVRILVFVLWISFLCSRRKVER